MATLKLNVSGMHCGHCVLKVEKALKGVPGAFAAQVDLEAGKAEVDFDGRAAPERFLEAVRGAGYAAQVAA